MPPLDFVAAVLTGVLIFGQILWVLLLVAGAFMAFLALVIINEIAKRLRKERRWRS